MTHDPIEAICEEMESNAADIRASLHAPQHADDDDAYHAMIAESIEKKAARLRAWWSPQRKAFHEAAMELEPWFALEDNGGWSWKEALSKPLESSDAFLRRDSAIHQFVNARSALRESEKK
jgi:hypothetical protein